ncbi:MAG: tetratricopeptide repeat protein [Bacteroidota bacterium]|nr:tetratricopeptide repeat protein [Bacteroidota bacterium]
MRLLFIYWFCTCTLTSVVLAQPQRADRTRPVSQEEQLDDNANSRYLLALGYLRGMQFDRAIAVLRELHHEYPEHKTIFDTLKEAYVNTKQYQEAILLLDDAIIRSDEIQKLPLEVERAQLLYLGGGEPAALDSWYSAVESALETETAYRIAYNSMVEVRLLVQAIDLLKQGREVIGNRNAFHAELAYLYSLTGQHEFATQEYLDLLTLNPRQLNYVRGRLGRDMQQEGALEVVVHVTQERVLAQPDLLQLRELLAWLYEESGNFEQAYGEITAIEEDHESSGQEIYQFALRAAEAGAFTVAGSAFQAVLETHPKEDIFEQARLGIADMYRLQAERADKSPEDYQKSLEAYERFLMDFPGHPQAPTVMAQIAALHQDVFRNRDTARVILQQLATQYMNSPIGQEAQSDLGRLAIEEGDLDQAATIFAQLSARTSGELFARSKFEEAMIHFYKGEFTAAQSTLGDIRDETDKETANDAIALRVLLLESPQPDSSNLALLSYAQALLLLRQQKANETVMVTQDILTQWGAHPIADEARFLRAEALLLNGQSEDALIAFGEFPLIHPESPLRDRSLFHYAEILETVHGDTARALQAYTDLLTQHPGSLLVEKVRERIRALRATNL